MGLTGWEVYIETNVTSIENVYGVYELSNSKTDSSKITYIGRGKIHDELMHYLNGPCTGSSLYFRYEQTFSDKTAKERER